MKKKAWLYSPFLITVLFFVFSVIVRYELSDFLKKIYVYPDELRYFSIAESLFEGRGLMLYNQSLDFQKILYSIVIMPAFAFSSRLTQIKAICLINALVMSSGIFPIYLLAKNILQEKKYIVRVLLLYVTMPDLAYTMTFMSEVIFLPLSLWTLYFFYKLLVCQDKRRGYLFSGGLGVLIYILYLNKEIALSFLVAYATYTCMIILKTRKLSKESLIRCLKNSSSITLIIMVGTFFALFLIFKMTVFRGMGNSYNQMGISAISSWYKIGYMFYGYFYYLLCVLIAFFYFPIMFTFVNLRTIRTDRKQFFILLFIILLVSAGVIAYTITVREDLGRVVPRIHLRYICFLFLPMVMVFLSEYEGIYINRKKKIIAGLMGALVVTTIILFFQGVLDSSSVDETALNYISDIQSIVPIEFLTDSTTMIFNGIKLVLCLGIIIGTYAICMHKRGCVSVLIIVMLFLNGINNFSAIKQYRSNYGMSETVYGEIKEINEFIESKLNENFVILSVGLGDVQRVLDTYISLPNVFTVSAEQFLQAGREGIEKVDEMEIRPLIGVTPYKNLHTIDYLIVADKNSYIIKSGCEEVFLDNVDRYKVYKMSDNKKIPQCKDALPEAFGESVFLPASADLFYSTEKLTDGKFISRTGNRYLAYGPYKKITKGSYSITFYYDYTGTVSGGETVGFVDINTERAELLKYNTPIKAGQNQVNIDNVEIQEDYNRFETRMFSFVPGVEFKGISITKIAE